MERETGRGRGAGGFSPSLSLSRRWSQARFGRGRGIRRQQRLDELVAEQLHERERIQARDGNKGSMRGNQALGYQAGLMGMTPERMSKAARLQLGML